VFQRYHSEKPEFYPQDGGESQLALKLRIVILCKLLLNSRSDHRHFLDVLCYLQTVWQTIGVKCENGVKNNHFAVQYGKIQTDDFGARR